MFFRINNQRIKLVLIIILIYFVFIFIRVFYIQTISYERLESLADDLWSRELPIIAERGDILDRNGKMLATSITTTSLVLIPSQIKDKESTTKLLSEALNVSYNEIYEHVNKKASIERVHPEGRKLSSEVADLINSYNLEGVYLVKEATRSYPYGNMLSHVLGYVGIDNQGLSGIELAYDDYLKGIDGAIKYYSDAKGNKLELSDIYQEPTSGMDIMLTIDYDIQVSIERELNNVMTSLKPDNALAVAINPNTGEILGMSSRPNYDPNNFSKYSQEILSRNLPVWSTYEPGSTFKIITTAAAVEEGIVNLEKDHFYDSGKVNVSGANLKCWKSGGHGDQTFLQVFENSCNPGFVQMGLKLGKEKLFGYLDLFGFGEKTGIDLSGEGKGIIFPLDKVGDLELATTAFGQGVSVTPIQQVTAVSSIVNGGYLYKPYILKSIVDNKTNNIYLTKEKELVRKTISTNTSNIMRMALESVVSNGGGKRVYIDGYRVGGKTGTAQKAKNGKYLVNNYIMSFMAVLPSNNPEVVLYFAIDNPKNTALLSSYTTTPYVRRILLDIISALDIEKQDNAKELDYEWYNKKYYEVPNVIGLSIKEAKKLLTNFKIEYVGKGNKVLEQTPSANERYYEEGIIRLLLGD